MNRLEQMIKELCPNGVEYKELHEILTIKNGSDYKDFGEGDILSSIYKSNKKNSLYAGTP